MSQLPIRLGVNIDHVATLRQQRGTRYPSPLAAAFIAQSAGADSITAHLREDRRHIQDRDIHELRQALGIPLNLEMAVEEGVLALAAEVQPQACCFVPERREELTTEGGLDVLANLSRIKDAIARMREFDARCSLFIEADPAQADAAREAGAQAVELHTGHYAEMDDPADQGRAVEQLRRVAAHAQSIGLEVHAGHGLHLENIAPIARISPIVELNIGHSIVADAVIMGMAAAVARMKAVMLQGRQAPTTRSAI